MTAIGMQDPFSIFFRPPAIRAGLMLWTVELVLAVGLVAVTVSLWRRKSWRLVGRVWLTLVCVGAFGAALWLYHWNLWGWNY